MSAHDCCFELMWFWEGHEKTRLLFADLVETEPSLRYMPGRPDVPVPWPDWITFEYEGDGVEDVPFQVFGWLLVSERIKRLIEEHALTGITFHPIRVVSKVGFPLPRYWYGHLHQLSDAIDFERSVYSRRKPKGYDDEILFVVKHAFKRAAVEGWDFFRPSDSRQSMFCSHRFHELALKHRCTGIGFRPVPVS